MAYFIEDANTVQAGTTGMAVSNDNTLWDFIPTGDNTIISGTYKVNSGWNGDGQSGTPGVNYPYRTTTIVTVTHQAKMFKFELQDLKGGALFTAGFNNGTKADLADAIQMIKSWS